MQDCSGSIGGCVNGSKANFPSSSGRHKAQHPVVTPALVYSSKAQQRHDIQSIGLCKEFMLDLSF